MILTPTGNEGNYFSQQTRTSSRFEWRETWSFSQQVWGTHNVKIGTVVLGTAEHAQIQEHPVDILDAAGALHRKHHLHAGPAHRADRCGIRLLRAGSVDHEFALSLNVGVRVSQQEVTDVWQVGPRAGLVISPFQNGRTIFRAGTGIFYDRVPLNVYGFALYPDETITTYNPDGTVLSGPDHYFNLTEAAAPHHSPLIYRANGSPGNFSPYSINSNLQVEQILSSRLRLRAELSASQFVGADRAFARGDRDRARLCTDGDGNARFRQMEVTGAGSFGKESQIFLSYVHSYGVGNLNEFNTYLANFPPAVILPDAHTYPAGRDAEPVSRVGNDLRSRASSG